MQGHAGVALSPFRFRAWAWDHVHQRRVAGPEAHTAGCTGLAGQVGDHVCVDRRLEDDVVVLGDGKVCAWRKREEAGEAGGSGRGSGRQRGGGGGRGRWIRVRYQTPVTSHAVKGGHMRFCCGIQSEVEEGPCTQLSVTAVSLLLCMHDTKQATLTTVTTLGEIVPEGCCSYQASQSHNQRQASAHLLREVSGGLGPVQQLPRYYTYNNIQYKYYK